jgi:transcriptional regulator with XRE-family HTH domain
MGKHMLLANRLKELRRALGWTQQDLSRGSGLTRSYISRLEMGDIALPSSEKLRALANSLGTTPDDLLQAAGYIDTPSQDNDLPELKVYLRRRYSIQDPRTLQAIETIIVCLQPGGATNLPAIQADSRRTSGNRRGKTQSAEEGANVQDGESDTEPTGAGGEGRATRKGRKRE